MIAGQKIKFRFSESTENDVEQWCKSNGLDFAIPMIRREKINKLEDLYSLHMEIF
jgi:hypothetical protein